MNFLLTDQILIKKNCNLLFIMNFYLIKRNVVRLEQFSFIWQRFTPTIDKIGIKIVHVVQEILSHPNVKFYLCVNFVHVCWWAFSSSMNVSSEMKKMTNTYKLKHENEHKSETLYLDEKEFHTLLQRLAYKSVF